jgi:UrcA family protein
MTRLALYSLAAAALIPAAAFAQSDAAQVRYDDLNLSTPAGAKTLDKRIAIAARQVCRAASITGTRIVDTHAEKACTADVRRQVEAQLIGQGVALARN